MNLYLLKRNETDDIGYDETISVVVSAKNATDARAIAAVYAGDEGSKIWTTPALHKLNRIGTAHFTCPVNNLICRDFRAG